MSLNEKLFYFYFYAVVAMSFVAIVLYLIDKILAKNGNTRIPEKILLFFAVFFGGIGSFIGRILFRHKTQKIYFSIVIYYSMLLQIATFVFLLFTR